MANDESAPRQGGWQTNRLPTHARTVLVRLDEHRMPVWLAYYDANRWRSLNRGHLKFEVKGWIELSECALLLDQIENPSDS